MGPYETPSLRAIARLGSIATSRRLDRIVNDRDLMTGPRRRDAIYGAR
jgi:hypothetical protein